MILDTLTPKQTDIWIKNLNKVIDVRNAVKKYHNANYDCTEKLFNDSYGLLYKAWHGIDDFSDLYLGWDGYYRTPGSLTFGKVKKLGVVPDHLLHYKRSLRYVYRDTRDTLLERLKQKWEHYATQPFQIQEGDLEMYQNLHVWHRELKDILEEGGVYDEAFNLDEDC